MEVSSDESKRVTIRIAVEALVRCKREFKGDLTPSVLAELYVARELYVAPAELCNHPGYDLLGDDGKRYQVKHRGASVLNVDLNNFDFDLSRARQLERRLPAPGNVASAGEYGAKAVCPSEKSFANTRRHRNL